MTLKNGDFVEFTYDGGKTWGGRFVVQAPHPHEHDSVLTALLLTPKPKWTVWVLDEFGRFHLMNVNSLRKVEAPGPPPPTNQTLMDTTRAKLIQMYNETVLKAAAEASTARLHAADQYMRMAEKIKGLLQ